MRPVRRQKLFLVLAWSVVSVAMMSAATDLWRIKYYRPRAERWDLNAYALQQSRQAVDLLFLGSSRFLYGINATVVSDVVREAGLERAGAYNVAQPGSSVVLSQILLRDLIASNGCPRLVVLEVSPGGLNHSGPWWPALADYSGPRDVLRLAPTVQSLDQLNFLLASPLRGGIRLYDRLTTPPNPDRLEQFLAARGSKFSETSWKGQTDHAGPDPTRIQWASIFYRRHFWRNLHIGDAQVKALDGVLDLAEECRSDVILVRMPTLLWLDPGDKERVDGVFLRFMARFAASRDVTFIDGENTPDKLTAEYFYDPVHIGDRGALLFSRNLARDVLLPTLERNP